MSKSPKSSKLIDATWKPLPADKKEAPKEAEDKKDPNKEAADKKDPNKEAIAKNKEAWEAPLAKIKEKWPPKAYQVGRGKYAELGNLIVQQHPEASVDYIRTLLSLCESERGTQLLQQHPRHDVGRPAQAGPGTGIALDTLHRKGKHGQT